MSFIVAANWKMHKNPEQSKSFFSDFKQKGSQHKNFDSCLFFAPAVNLTTVASACAGTSLGWGPQNVYPEVKGAFTGENSPQVMKEIGSTHALVGHSERRTLFGEKDEDCNLKMKSLLQQGICPILCIGETLEQRKTEKTLEVLEKQITQGLEGVSKDQKFHIAYEPVWAIGTGEVASSEQVGEAHQFIRKILNQKYTDDVHILYGGSVKGANASELSQVEQVSGFLVGGASLEVDSFCQILQAID